MNGIPFSFRNTLIWLAVLLAISPPLFAVPERLADDGRSGSWSILASDDFDGDGRDDLLWGNGTNLEIDFMDGKTVTSTTAFNGEVAYEFAGTGDFSGDGAADIVWYSRGVDLLLYLSDDSWDENSSYTLDLPNTSPEDEVCGSLDLKDAWEVAGIGDFDNDQDDDIYWRNQPQEASSSLPDGSGRNMVELLDFTGSAFDRDLLGEQCITGDRWRVFGIGDFDGDNHDDIVWQKTTLSAASITVQRLSFEPFNTGDDCFYYSGNGIDLTACKKELWTPGSGWEVRAVRDFLGDRKADIFLRNETSQTTKYKAYLHELDVDDTVSPPTPYRIRVDRYDGLKFEDPRYDLATVGDLDGDGNADTVWRDETLDETWIWLTKQLRAVHLKPKLTTWPDPGDMLFATQWVLGIEPCDPFKDLSQTCPQNDPGCLEPCTGSEVTREELRTELQAIKSRDDRPGLRQVKVEFGVGKTFDFPDPDIEQLKSVASFLLLLKEEDMAVTFNIGNHCWVPNDLIDGLSDPTKFEHVGGHNKDGCYQKREDIPCDSTCQPVHPNCAPSGSWNCDQKCIKMKWDMPSCKDDDNLLDDPEDYSLDHGWITESRQYYSTILTYLETHVPEIRKTVLYFNLNGSPVLPSPSEPAAFKENFFGDPANSNFAPIREAVTRYYHAVYDVARASTSVPIGMKSNVGARCTTPDYTHLENIRTALGDIVEEIDFFDFTSSPSTDVDEILTALGITDSEEVERRLSTIALTDFFTQSATGSCHDLEEHELAGYMQCFFDEVAERGLLGWWFQTFRNDDIGLIDTDGDTSDDADWNLPAVEAIRNDLNYLDGSQPATCEITGGMPSTQSYPDVPLP